MQIVLAGAVALKNINLAESPLAKMYLFIVTKRFLILKYLSVDIYLDLRELFLSLLCDRITFIFRNDNRNN